MLREPLCIFFFSHPFPELHLRAVKPGRLLHFVPISSEFVLHHKQVKWPELGSNLSLRWENRILSCCDITHAIYRSGLVTSIPHCSLQPVGSTLETMALENTPPHDPPPLHSAVDTPRHEANGLCPRESSTRPTPRKKRKNSPPAPHTQFQPTAGLVPGKMKTHTFTHPTPGSGREGRKKGGKCPRFDWAADWEACLKNSNLCKAFK